MTHDGWVSTESFLPAGHITAWINDHEGGNWFGSLNNGLYYTPASTLSFMALPGKINPNQSKCVSADSLLFLSRDNLIYCFSPTYELIYTYRFNEQIENFYLIENVLIARLHSGVSVKAKIHQPDSLKELIIRFHAPVGLSKHFVWTGNFVIYREKKSFLLGSSIEGPTMPLVGYYEMRSFKDGEELFYKENLNVRIRRLFPINDQTVLLGTEKGFFKFYINDESNSFNRVKSELFNTRISDIDTISNHILIATDKNGVVILNKEFNMVQQINRQNGLSSNLITDIEVHENHIWLSTDQGVDEIIYNSGKWQVVGTLTDKFKLDHLSVDQVKYFNGDLILNSSMGFLRMQTKAASSVTYPSIQYQVGVKNAAILQEGENKLPYQHEPIIIHFNPINFNQLPVEFQYRINNKNWQDASRQLQLSELQFGDYEITFRGRYKGGEWNLSPTVLDFTVATPYYFSWWFIALSLIGISGSIYFLLNRAYRNKQERSELLIKHHQSELKALRLQMNPHFLFNVLASIQAKIMQGDKMKAISSVSSFSRMMRRILNFSNESWISLQEELTLLKEYVSLEQERMVNQFEFRINTNIDDPERILLPPLVLQPLIENAIWHGVEGLKQRKGTITLSVSKEKNYLKCIVEDNGRGNQKKTNDEKKSIALENIKTRLSLWSLNNKKEDSTYHLQIEYIQNERQEPITTRVTVTIPYEEAY